MARRHIIFLVNLLQDVNILRGLIYLAARETGAELHLLVSGAFLKRDKLGIWQPQLAAIARETGATMHLFDTTSEAQAVLQGRAGLVIAASESNLDAHWQTRDVFRVTPSGFLKITLQHGLECVGFLQSREHVVRHGRDITFNADVICSWLEPERLTSTTVSQRGKVIVTGPPTLLQRPRVHANHPPTDGGIICENMHSARLQATGDHKASFMHIFFEFCDQLARKGRSATLRPHPGGQYVLKNEVELPTNVHLNNLPIFEVNMPAYQYGISAPSTVVFDMVLAGIPVGVWRDPGGVMDANNYAGLTEISTLPDWLAFEAASREDPAPILARQAVFLAQLGVPTDPAEIYRRFARLLVNGLTCGAPSAPVSTQAPMEVHAQDLRTQDPAPVPASPAPGADRTLPQRVLYVANGLIATLQLSFLKPMAPFVESGRMTAKIVTEADLVTRFGDARYEADAAAWLASEIRDFAPDMIVCCRYSGPHADTLLETARALEVPVIFHIDDDLLNIPRELGESKYRMHNDSRRLASVRRLLDGAGIVYASTEAMAARLRAQGVHRPIFQGGVYCTSRILRPATPGPVRRVGYMGTSSHAHDFEIVLPGLERYLEANLEVEFELFGLKDVPARIARFGDRVRTVPTVNDYAAFLRVLADRAWDIGLCPLKATPFNAVKANTKWVEYTSCGITTIASRGMVYDCCAGEGRGLLVHDDEWCAALQVLTDAPALRHGMAVLAQTHLLLDYSEEKLRAQVLDAFACARAALAQGHRPGQPARASAADPSPRARPARPDADGLLRDVR